MNTLTATRQFMHRRLPLILTIYILIQPLLDVLTNFGAEAGHSLTAGTVVRALFLVFAFLYTLFSENFEGKKLCLIAQGALTAYLLLFMIYMFSLGGVSLCVANVKELVKVFFAPYVIIFLYTVYRQIGYLVSTRTIAITGGIYAGVILFAYLTGTSGVSYGNSGYGFKGWFYAANEVSCVIALTAPVLIYYCLKQIPTITKKTWWKGVLIALAFIALVFSANFLATKIIFGITLIYCLAAFVWSLVRAVQTRSRGMIWRFVVSAVLVVLIALFYLSSPLRGYSDNIYVEMAHKDSELVAISLGLEVQKASAGTWLRSFLDVEGSFMAKLDWLLSRRLLTSASSLQVYLDGGLLAKLLGIGYANAPSYTRSVEFMIEMDPFALLVRHGILGFALYFVPYLVSIVYAIVQFFKHPVKRLMSLKYCSYLYSALAAFGISIIAGHALVSPGVSIFVLVVALSLWVQTQEQNRALKAA